jgi:sugar (pentulose or hexulose) kinase
MSSAGEGRATDGEGRSGLVVAVDIGTMGVNVAAVDAAAVSHCGAEREYPTSMPHAGWSELDPDVIAAATAEAIPEMAAAVTAGRALQY